METHVSYQSKKLKCKDEFVHRLRSMLLPAIYLKGIQQKIVLFVFVRKKSHIYDGGRSLMHLSDLDVWLGIATEATWLQ